MDVARNRATIIGLSRCVALNLASNLNAELKVVDIGKFKKYQEQDLDAMDSIFNLQPSQVLEESEGEEEGPTATGDWIEPQCDLMEPADEDAVDKHRESEVHDADKDADVPLCFEPAQQR
jgi:hypothetical protein